MIKRLAAALAMVTTVCAFSLISYAAEPGTKFIRTTPVPEGAQECAKDRFSNLSQFTLDAMGITGSLDDLKLSTGFNVEMLDETGKEIYYFPIFEENKIVAVLTVIGENGGNWRYTLNSELLSPGLESLTNTQDNPAQIVVTGHAAYAVQNDSITNITESVELSDSDRERNISRLQTATYADTEETAVVALDESNTFAETRAVSPRYTASGRKCDALQRIPNDPNCWEATCGMYIEYVKSGDNYSASTARGYAYELKANKSYDRSTAGAKKALKDYTGRTLSSSVSRPAWTKIKSQILDKDNPIYMGLEKIPDGAGHAALLGGYQYNYDDPNNSEYYYMLIVDSNIPGWQEQKYGSTYDDSLGYSYNWTTNLTY